MIKYYRRIIITTLIVAMLFGSVKLFSQTITASGTIDENTIWQADVVNITGDIYIADGITLMALPGSSIFFTDNYKIEVKGSLQALGTTNSPITFTIDSAKTDASAGRGWSGICFDNISTANDSSKLVNCNFSYGKAVGTTDSKKNGGVIYVNSVSKLEIKNCSFQNNLATENGGAIFCDNSSPLISKNDFYANSAYENGGAICCMNKSSPVISGNTLTYNNTYDDGGAIFCDSYSSPIITDNVLENNSALQNGGAISAQTGCTPKITWNTINSNSAADLGGGIHTYNFESSSTIINNIILNNSSKISGGGIYDGNPCLRLINNLICNNYANVGGGIFNGLTNSKATYTNNTVCNNLAVGIGGIMCYSDSIKLINNIIYGNEAEDNPDSAQIGYRSDTITVQYCIVEGGFIGEGNSGSNPYFYYPTDNAGPEYSNDYTIWQLSENSPCIDSGKPDTVDLYLPEYDLAGNERIIGIVDIGAYEANLEAVVETDILKKESARLQLYPNPCTDYLIIDDDVNSLMSESIEIFNILGEKIKQPVEISGNTINVTAINPGIYIAKISYKGQIVNKRFVKK